jgi:DNA repair exonuclease SbcCD ATPase subunit
MLKLNGLTIKNFMSIGNVTQSINFSSNDLVLVLGENLDLGGNDNRNGVGKSTIVNALSYALFGSALTKIKKDNLINKTNMKNMLVTLTFEVNGVDYRIERGRKPGIFKFIKDGVEDDTEEGKDSNESQGENRHTQEEIERTVGISHNMFKHILALNTYVEPFLALGTSEQREIIEQLLGITKLSEKAEKLKDESKTTRDEIKEEEFRISAATEANKRIEQNIQSLLAKSSAWENGKNQKIEKLQTTIMELLSVDIDTEISLHKSKKEVEDLKSEYRSLVKELNALEKDVTDSTKTITRLDRVLANSVQKICPTCNQDMDKDTHEHVHNEYLSQYEEAQKKLKDKITKRDEVKTLADSVCSLIPELPETHYDTVDQAYNHKTTLDTLGNSLATELDATNPYTDQIEALRRDGLQVIDFTKLNELVKLRDHQEFLSKLLTNKDSFIRKKIIDQNLAFLNHRLAHYLADIGLPHEVKFKSDLEVEITMYGKEFDFDNLSRGERTRLILSLSWSFRDVWESMNDKINLLFIDELIDSGLDSSGVESSLAILKKMSRENKRNIFLISHRDELIGRVSNVLKVVKEGGFTSLETSETEQDAVAIQ